MNKKAFTLVELLAVIIIISLIGGIGTIAYTNLIRKTSTDVFERYQDTMHAEAIQYVANHYGEITYTNDKTTILLANLPIDTINNPNNKSDTCINNSSYVEITRTRSTSGVLSMSYKVCLNCPSSNFNRCKTYEN